MIKNLFKKTKKEESKKPEYEIYELEANVQSIRLNFFTKTGRNYEFEIKGYAVDGSTYFSELFQETRVINYGHYVTALDALNNQIQNQCEFLYFDKKGNISKSGIETYKILEEKPFIIKYQVVREKK